MYSESLIISEFDEFWKIADQSKLSCLEEFLRFVTSQENCRIKWLESVREVQTLKDLIDKVKKENNLLNLKLSTAQKLLEQERHSRLKIEEEKKTIIKQLQTVQEVLITDKQKHPHNETRNTLVVLNSTNRISNDNNQHLSAIQEVDSKGSMISDISFSHPPQDDFDVESVHSVVWERTNHNKPQLSTAGCKEIMPSLTTRGSHTVQVHNEDGVPERRVATTTIAIEQDSSESAKSQCKSTPSADNFGTSAPLRTDSLESVDSGLTIEKNTGYINVNPNGVGVLSIGAVNTLSNRIHMFTSKTVFRAEECDVCEKRINFGYKKMCCQDCKACCHPLCKSSLPLPCVAPGRILMSKNHMGLIGDYAPASPPMVPALIIHCLKEIEERGLTEEGIYRTAGPKREIRALQGKFLKNRGVPLLSRVDNIHVICDCFKIFLRSLREPIVTRKLWWQFVEAAEKHDIDDRRAKLYQAISLLPQPNKDTLAYIILHLLRVAECKEINKMTLCNLATVLGLIVVGIPPSVSENPVLALKATLVLKQFLTLIPAEYWQRIMSGVGNTP